MEAAFLFLLFVFVIVVFIILLVFKSSTSFKQRLILRKIEDLKNDINELKTVGLTVQVEKTEKVVIEKEEVVQKESELIEEIKKEVPEQKIEEVKKEEPEIELEKKVEIPEEPEVVKEEEPVLEKEGVLVEEESSLKAEKLETANTTQTIHEKVKQPVTPPKPKKKTDFEKFIGENLLNKIGIVILVLALIFFGKYAVDKGWLNDTAKVVAIVAIGGILIGLAHKLRVNYRAFSSVLAGGGLASLYISVAVGFQLYGLFTQTAAFIILIIVTILAVLLALAYDKKELAVIAIFGGFASPMLVSTGEGNYKVLFTYILILDIGMLVLAYYKKWNLVNFVANFATLILFAAWLIKATIDDKIPHVGAVIFVTGFYLVFFLMNIINNVKEKKNFSAFEFLMVVTNTFLYFWAGMYIIGDYNENYMGLFTTCLAVFNFVFAYPLYKRKQIDKNLIFLLIGLVLTFVSIAIPVQFKGKYITMFWAAEAVLLLWLGQQSGIKLMKIASYIVSFFMVVSLTMDWFQIYLDRPHDADPLPLLINEGFITGIVSVVAFYLLFRLLKNEAEKSDKGSPMLFSNLFIIVLIISLYIIFQLELIYQVDINYDDSYLVGVAIAFYNYLYFAVVLAWSSIKQKKYILEGITLISLVSVLVYVVGVMPSYRKVIDYYLMDDISSTFSLIHFGTALLVLVICFYLWRNMELIFKGQKTISNIMLWFSIIIGVIVLSFELDYMVLLGNSANIDENYSLVKQTHLIGWPILWGVLAFTLMIIGIKRNERMFRIIGISLFFFALLKLFAIDVWDMPEGGRIAAFISLGVLLLVISFMYQKLKKVIFEEEEGNEVEVKE